jgi:hypothetical protein
MNPEEMLGKLAEYNQRRAETKAKLDGYKDACDRAKAVIATIGYQKEADVPGSSDRKHILQSVISNSVELVTVPETGQTIWGTIRADRVLVGTKKGSGGSKYRDFSYRGEIHRVTVEFGVQEPDEEIIKYYADSTCGRTSVVVYGLTNLDDERKAHYLQEDPADVLSSLEIIEQALSAGELPVQ